MVVGHEGDWCREAGSGFDLAVEATVVEPVDVGKRRDLDIVEASLWSFRVKQLPFCKAR